MPKLKDVLTIQLLHYRLESITGKSAAGLASCSAWPRVGYRQQVVVAEVKVTSRMKSASMTHMPIFISIYPLETPILPGNLRKDQIYFR